MSAADTGPTDSGAADSGAADRPRYDVVIPTIGRAGLAALVTAADGRPGPGRIVVADDRPQPAPELELPRTRAELVVVHSGGRGPAAARNAGWRAADADWVAFLDDDVALPDDWNARLVADLSGLPDTVGASQGRLQVPLPPGHRPTDEERRSTGLVGIPWITADLAYRRAALVATGGFDERFPRAYREDSDLAVRTQRAGYSIVWGDRLTTHPAASRGGWRSSIRAQAGNADNALLRHKYGPQWRQVIGSGPGRMDRHLLTVAALAVTVVGLATRHRRTAAGAAAAWAVLTAEFAVRRILPGPGTPAEIVAMTVTSAAIPPVAVAHRLRGELRVRFGAMKRPGDAIASWSRAARGQH